MDSETVMIPVYPTVFINIFINLTAEANFFQLASIKNLISWSNQNVEDLENP